LCTMIRMIRVLCAWQFNRNHSTFDWKGSWNKLQSQLREVHCNPNNQGNALNIVWRYYKK
jgi:hypothetical protein